jgi:hypothetical protein
MVRRRTGQKNKRVFLTTSNEGFAIAFSTPTLMMIPRGISHQSMAASPLYCKGRKAVAEILNYISKEC